MIRIIINLDKENKLDKLKVSGHSNFNKKGSDIVCSAVSVLVQTCYLAISNLPVTVCDYRDNGIDLYLEVAKSNAETAGELRGITMFLITGLKAVSKTYVNQVDLIIN